MNDHFAMAADLKAALDSLEADLFTSPVEPAFALPLEQQPFASFFHS
jgi:hypothetical protein